MRERATWQHVKERTRKYQDKEPDLEPAHKAASRRDRTAAVASTRAVQRAAQMCGSMSLQDCSANCKLGDPASPHQPNHRSDKQRREKRTRNMAVKRARTRRLGPAARGALWAAHAAVEKKGAHERARALCRSGSSTRGAQPLANDPHSRRGGQRRCELGRSSEGMVRRAAHQRGGGHRDEQTITEVR